MLGSIVYFFMLREHWFALCFAGFVTFLYSAPKLPQDHFKYLKEIAIGKTLFLAFVWMFVTTLLPIFVENEKLTTQSILFAGSRFFLIYAICIIFDYRDREDDKKDGIRSLVTYLNEKGINYLFAANIISFALCTLALLQFQYSYLRIGIILIPGILVAFLYNYSKKNYSDYLYYFILDGLMMLSGLLLFIFKI
jgi:4-hydroxybenzoate polyprenyltransferase